MTTTVQKEVTPFTQTLNFLERGCLNAELTEELAELVKAVRETGRKGTVTLKINVALMKGSEDTVNISADVNTSKPRSDRAQTIMFSTYDGDLLRDDPHQASLDLREVLKPATQFKQVGNGGSQ